jgi:hypothetical protein
VAVDLEPQRAVGLKMRCGLLQIKSKYLGVGSVPLVNAHANSQGELATLFEQPTSAL